MNLWWLVLVGRLDVCLGAFCVVVTVVVAGLLLAVATWFVVLCAEDEPPQPASTAPVAIDATKARPSGLLLSGSIFTIQAMLGNAYEMSPDA